MNIKRERLFDSVCRMAETCPESAAVYERHNKEISLFSHREVFEKICSVRSEYLSLPFQRIGLIAENSAAYLFLSSGILLTGKTLAFLDAQANLSDLIHIIRLSDLDAIVYDQANEDLITEIKTELPGIAFLSAVIPTFSPQMEERSDDWVEGDTLFYTSGTSKSAKVVVTGAWALANNVTGLSHLREYEMGKTVLIPVPYFHSYGYTSLFYYYQLGCPVFVSSMRTILKDIAAAEPAHIVLVPSAVEFLLKKNAFGDSVKYVLVSGAFLAPELAAKVKELGIVVQNQYGSSEIPSGFALNRGSDPIDALSPSQTVQLSLSPDGEVIVRTQNHFSEYYRNPEDTAEMLRKDGLIYTGDMGFFDEENRLHLLGRRKNMILMENGDKVFYTDLDEALKALPEIEDAAVIYADQMLIAAVTPTKGCSQATVEHAISQFNTTQPIGRVIRRVWLYGPQLPYTNSGKLARSVLEKEYPHVFSNQ